MLPAPFCVCTMAFDSILFYFFQAEDGIRDWSVTEFRRVLFRSYSYSNQPPDLYVQKNRPGQDLRRITISPSAEFAQYAWQDPPIVMVPARDGVKVPARMYKPVDYKKGGPAVIFIHGSGYLQNVDHKWSTYY